MFLPLVAVRAQDSEAVSANRQQRRGVRRRCNLHVSVRETPTVPIPPEPYRAIIVRGIVKAVCAQVVATLPMGRPTSVSLSTSIRPACHPITWLSDSGHRALVPYLARYPSMKGPSANKRYYFCSPNVSLTYAASVRARILCINQSEGEYSGVGEACSAGENL